MIFRAALRSFPPLAAFLLSTAIAAEKKPRSSEPMPKHGPPRNLLTAERQWQPQGGEWKLDASGGTASVTAGDTVAELASNQGVALAGHWLSLKAALSGDAARAGVRFSGLRDDSDQTLRVVLDAGAGAITNGRGKTLAPLPNGAFRDPVEIVMTFSADKFLIEHAGAKLGEFPVKYEERTPTPSLFAERGTVDFRELLLSGDPLAVEAAAPAPPKADPAAPDKPVEKPAVVGAPRVVLDFTGADMRALKSGWNDYFGIHFETVPGPWKTIRQYDGPSFGTPLEDRHSGDVKTFDGPFAKMPVQVSLGDFGDWERKDAKRLDTHIKTLIEEERAAVFIAPWVRPFSFEEQDRVWALMKLLYGGNVGAEGRVFFQWGDDINSRHLGAALNHKIRSSKPRGSGGRGGNKEDDISAYVEHYFAPAVEAVRLASDEIYKDPARIPVLIGSCSHAAEPKNREWFARVLDSTIEGSLAQSLKGRKVVDLVSHITIDYPFYKSTDAAALQEIWDRFGARVKGLWVTEEYGATGKGPADLLRAAALYLEWAAKNQLDANQTRLLWNIPEEKKDKFGVRGVFRKLGESFTDPLRVASQKAGESMLYRIASGENRMLIVNIPDDLKRGKKPADLGELALTVAGAQATKPWTARYLSEKERKAPAGGKALEVLKDGSNLVVKIDASPRDEWAVIVETR